VDGSIYQANMAVLAVVLLNQEAWDGILLLVGDGVVSSQKLDWKDGRKEPDIHIGWRGRLVGHSPHPALARFRESG
jgi:hypothetical protein